MEHLVIDALDCVATECPLAYRAMETALANRRVALVVSGESFAISLTTASEATGDPIAPAVRIETTARVVRDVLTGERDPLEAVLADDLVVHGDADDLVAASEAGLFFVKGAARCTSMGPLLARLANLAEREGKR